MWPSLENVIDEISEKIGMDPMEVRLRNAAREGTRRIDGVVYPAWGLSKRCRPPWIPPTTRRQSRVLSEVEAWPAAGGKQWHALHVLLGVNPTAP
jgi:hypothetical protein